MKAKHVKAVGGRLAVGFCECGIQLSRPHLPVEQLQERQRHYRTGFSAAEAHITHPASPGRALRSGVKESAQLEKVKAPTEK